MNKLLSKKDIADLFGVSLRTAEAKIIANPHFPKPITIPYTHKRWLADDIEKFCIDHKN